MRKLLLLIVVAIMLSGVVFAMGSNDITGNFHLSEISFSQIFADILNFFRSGITGLAGYSGTSNANLTIWDETDAGFLFAGQARYIDEQIFFYANFTNSTNVLTDSLANVSICINFTQPVCGNMSYNSTSKLWQFNTTPFYFGAVNWSVNATSVAENLTATDNASINNSCLNISNFGSIYYIKTSRLICPDALASFSIVFENVSSIDLECGNSTLTSNSPSSGAVVLNHSANISIHNCLYRDFNAPVISGTGQNISIFTSLFQHNNRAIEISDSKGINITYAFFDTNYADVYFANSSYSSITLGYIINSSSESIQILSGSNINISDVIIDEFSKNRVSVSVTDSNFTRISNLSAYNSLAGVLLGLAGSGTNNSIVNSYFENLSLVGFAAVNQTNFFANNTVVKNSPICIADAVSSNSAYRNLNLSGCSNISMGILGTGGISVQNLTFENSSIYSSNNTIYIENITAGSFSFLRNIAIYNSGTAVYLKNSNIGSIIKNLLVQNSSTGVYSESSSAGIADSILNVDLPANIQGGSEIIFTNISFNESAANSIADSSLLNVRWLFNVLVRDALSSIIANANVTLRNGSSIFSELTNSSGNILWENVSEYVEDSSGKTYQSYNLTVSSENYVQKTVDPQINESKMLEVILLGNGSLVVYSPLNGSFYNSRTIALNYSVLFSSRDSCWFFNSTGNRRNISNCANTTFNALEGVNNITVFANDTGGNVTFSKIFFTVDTVLPNITYFNISLQTNVSVYVNWTTSELTNMSLRYGTTAALSTGSVYNSTFNTAGSQLISGLSQHSSYSVNLTFCDMAQNCVIRSGSFDSGRGNFTPQNLHIPEAEIIVQELVASELTATPQRAVLTPGSRYIFTLDDERHSVKLKTVYTDDRAVFEFASDPIDVEVKKGGTAEVDLNGDSVNDLSVTVNDITMTKVTFDLKRISVPQKEEVPATPAQESPGFVAPLPAQNASAAKPAGKTFLEKYGIYMLISLIVVVAVIAGGGLLLVQRRRPIVVEIQEKKMEILAVPKTSRLETMMGTVYGMLKDNKTELDVQKYLEGLELEENIIKSIVFEIKTKNNKIDELVSFSKKQFSRGKSVSEVREILENAGWAKNIVEMATSE